MYELMEFGMDGILLKTNHQIHLQEKVPRLLLGYCCYLSHDKNIKNTDCA